MNVDKWYEEQSLVLKIILIVLPFVGWIMEILIRVSAYTRKQNNMDLVLLLLFILLGWTWIPLIIDVVYLATKGHLFMATDLEDVVNDTETVDAQPKQEEKAEEEDK